MREMAENTQQGTLADRTGASLRGRSVGRTLGQLQAGRQAGSGRARSRGRARLNWVSQGQRWGRCRVKRHAERVSRPARMKNRDCAAENAGRPTGAQRIGVVDAVAASQRGGDQRHYLVAGVGPARRIAQVQAPLYQLGKAEVQGHGGGKEQAGIVD